MVLTSPVFYSLENESCCEAVLPFLFSVLIFCGPLAAQTALLATATTFEKVKHLYFIFLSPSKSYLLLTKQTITGSVVTHGPWTRLFG